MNRNRVIWLAAVVLVAGIGVVYFMGRAPVSSDHMEGTIGAANRYQTEQISGGDVALTDPELQEFLQSDAFNKYATDAEFRKVVLDAEARKTIVETGKLSEAARAANQSPELAKVMRQSEVLKVVTRELARTANAAEAFKTIKGTAGLERKISAAELDALSKKPAAVEFLRSAEMEKVRTYAAANPEFWKLVSAKGAEEFFRTRSSALQKLAQVDMKALHAEFDRRVVATAE